MIQFIEALRAIATILIANSHFKGVYPTDLLSFGGGFGLALFYMISGFLLANIKPSTKLTSWYFKKVARPYVLEAMGRISRNNLEKNLTKSISVEKYKNAILEL